MAMMADEPAPVSGGSPSSGRKPSASQFRRPSDVFSRSVNGTWELVVSVADSAPYAARRFESGDLRRVFDVKNEAALEQAPTLWGLGSVTLRSSLRWDDERCELGFSGGDLRRSTGPWQERGADRRVLTVAYCDDEILVTREANAAKPDLFCLLKRKVLKWRKF